MRILLWPSSYLPAIGGVEWFVHDLACQLQIQGHTVAILDGRSEEAKIRFATWAGDDIQVFRVACYSPASVPDVTVKDQLGHLQSLLEEFNPDLVNVQFVGQQSYYAMRLHEKLRYKFVATAQGSDLFGLSSRSEFRQRLVLDCLQSVDAFTACSESLLGLAANLVPSIVSRSRVIPNGVKGLFFAQDECARPSAVDPYILACGRFVPIKGFDVLLEAFARIPDKPRLVIVGDGPERNRLIRLATDLAISDLVDFRGICPPEEIASLMRHSALFVLPSRHEGLSIAALEAMASGRPVVATRVGGMPQIVHSGYNGLLVEPEDPVGLATAITQMLSASELLGAFGKRSQKLALGYRIESVTTHYLSIYNQLVGQT